MKTLIVIAALLTACTNATLDEPEEGYPMCYTWPELSNGQPLGKKIVIPVPTGAGIPAPRPGAVDILQLKNGYDGLACQLSVTLLPPQYVPASALPGGVFPRDVQAITGERYNDSIISTPPAIFTGAPAIAVIEWGIGGVQAHAEVDFSNGAVVNIHASFVRVKAFIDIPSQSPTEAVAVILGAFVGPGWPRTPGAQRTYVVSPLQAGPGGFPQFSYGSNGYFLAVGAGVYPVPFYGKSVQLYGINQLAVPPAVLNTFDADIVFFRDVALGIPLGSFHVTSTRPGPVQVPNGAQFWTLQNNAADSHLVSAIFDLSI